MKAKESVVNEVKEPIISSITRDTVFAVANKLHAAGIKPTYPLIIKELGGGSNVTVSPHIKEWKDEQKQNLIDAATEIPPRLIANRDAFFANVWREATNLANEKLVAEQAVMEATKIAMNESLSEAHQELKDKNADLVAKTEALNNLIIKSDLESIDAQKCLQELTQANQSIVSKDAELTIQQARATAAENKATEQSLQLDKINSQLDSVRSQLEIKAKEHSDTAAKFAAVNATNNAQKTDIARLQADLLNSNQQHDSTRLTLTERTAERDKLKNSLTAAETRLSTTIDSLDAAKNEIKQLAAGNAELKLDLDRLKNDKQRLNDELTRATGGQLSLADELAAVVKLNTEFEQANQLGQQSFMLKNG